MLNLVPHSENIRTLDEVILVDETDNPTGTALKMDAHRKGLLHRAFSIFLFDGAGNTLLQRRAMTKYHSPGLWSNTCCSHPRPGEDTLHAAVRRLEEEMGIRDCVLSHRFSFTYRTEFPDGLIENEYDHVFTGIYHGDIDHDPVEVMDWKWAKSDELNTDVVINPQRYTYWVKAVLGKVLAL